MKGISKLPSKHSGRGTGVLLLPGLNMRPEGMEEIAAICRNRGALVQTVELPFQGRGRALEDGWREAVAAGYTALRESCLSVHVIGFSLGALLALQLRESLQNRGEPVPRLLLLALPLKLRLLPSLLRGVIWIPSAVFPTAAPRAIRSRGSTTGAAYRALFRVRRRVLAFLKDVRRLQAEALFAEKDEFVDSDGAARICKRSMAQVELLTAVPSGSRPRHLLAASSNAGTNWTLVCEAVSRLMD